MGWNATSAEKRELTDIVKRRLLLKKEEKDFLGPPDGLNERMVKQAPETAAEDYVKILVRAENFNQAKAFAAHIRSLNDLRKLRTWGFANVVDLTREGIDRVVGRQGGIEEVKADSAAEAHHREAAEQKASERSGEIDGYLATIPSKYRQHLSGTSFGGLNIGPADQVKCRIYRNSEGVVRDKGKPEQKECAEWYVMIGGDTVQDRSKGKRFITVLGSGGRMYYTDGGTHVKSSPWFLRGRDGKSWYSYKP